MLIRIINYPVLSSSLSKYFSILHQLHLYQFVKAEEDFILPEYPTACPATHIFSRIDVEPLTSLNTVVYSDFLSTGSTISSELIIVRGVSNHVLSLDRIQSSCITRQTRFIT